MISNSLNIDFILGDIHRRSYKTLAPNLVIFEYMALNMAELPYVIFCQQGPLALTVISEASIDFMSYVGNTIHTKMYRL